MRGRGKARYAGGYRAKRLNLPEQMFRMEAEMIRDSGLRVSGLLSAKIGGPSVFPPQPEGVWNIPYNDDQWKESKG